MPRRKRGSHTLPFAIDRVVPWGRTLAEYRGMFALTDADLRRRIVGCGDGPASFNAELTAQHGRVVSIDPLYAAPAREIERRVEETFEVVMDEVRRNRDDFVWTHVPSIEELGRRRLGAMRRFLSDYGAGGKRADTSRRRCRRCRSAIVPSIWPCHRTSCFCTASSWISRSTSIRCGRCCASPVRYACFRCCRSAARRRRTLQRPRRRCGRTESTPRLSRFPTSFSAVATGCCACAADSEAPAPFFAEPATQSSARRLRGLRGLRGGAIGRRYPRQNRCRASVPRLPAESAAIGTLVHMLPGPRAVAPLIVERVTGCCRALPTRRRSPAAGRRRRPASAPAAGRRGSSAGSARTSRRPAGCRR